MNVYVWLSLYLAVGLAVFLSMKLNAVALLDLTTRLRRSLKQDGRDDLAEQAEAGLRVGRQNPAYGMAASVLTWPVVVLQLFAMWFTVWRLERRYTGRPGLPTREEMIEDMIDERSEQIYEVYADRLIDSELALFMNFAARLNAAGVFGTQSEVFFEQAKKYRKRSDSAGAVFQLSGKPGDVAAAAAAVVKGTEVPMLLSVLVSIERAVTVSSMDMSEIDVSVVVSAMTRHGLVIGPEEAAELKAAGAVAAQADEIFAGTEREFVGEYWLHGVGVGDGTNVEAGAEQHWHGTLTASGAEPDTEEEKETVKKVVAFFGKVANALDLNSCMKHGDEETLDATIGAAQERKGPTA